MKVSFNWLYYADRVEELSQGAFFLGMFSTVLVYDIIGEKWVSAVVDAAFIMWSWRQMKSCSKALRGDKDEPATN